MRSGDKPHLPGGCSRSGQRGQRGEISVKCTARSEGIGVPAKIRIRTILVAATKLKWCLWLGTSLGRRATDVGHVVRKSHRVAYGAVRARETMAKRVKPQGTSELPLDPRSGDHRVVTNSSVFCTCPNTHCLW